jgi:hypothetical protein
MAEKWFFDILPQPTIATLILRPVMVMGSVRPKFKVEKETDIWDTFRAA